jgi:elongation factor G
MASFSTDRLRNVALVSHSGAGKTTLAEALLLASGAISRAGRTEDGNTTGDHEPEAVKRRSSTQLSVLPCVWRDHKVTLLDTPGYFDFVGDAISALRVADAAILMVSASSGVEVGTEQMWKRVRQLGIPCIIVVSKLDRENTDLSTVVEALRSTLGKECFAFHVPVGSAHELTGVLPLLPTPNGVPDEAQAAFAEARDLLVEAIAETDDDLSTKFLEGEALSDDELMGGLKRALVAGSAVPVLAASASQGVGITEVLDAIVSLLPSPQERPAAAVGAPGEDADQALEADPSGPLAVLAFKTTADPHVGKLTYLRVYSGTLASNTEVQNAGKRQAERLGQLFVPRGKSQENVTALVAGEIGAVGRLVATTTGDTLSSRDRPLALEGITFPRQLYAMAVFPSTKGDTEKLGTSLARLSEEDPSLHFTRDQNTNESLLSGMGDAHLEIAIQRAQRKFGVNLVLQSPKIPYRESITATARVDHRFKQQTGGHGHFAHIMLRMEPADRNQGLEFASEVMGGNVPKEFVSPVEKGVRRAWAEGILAGFPVVDARAVLYDGSYHPVDSAGQDFETCGYFGAKKAFMEASPMLLEPIASLQVTTPDAYTGEIIGDLNSKRGHIIGMSPQGDGTTLVEANVPLVEVQRYALDLRSMTQGRATFTLELDHYEALPASMTQRVVEQLKQE